MAAGAPPVDAAVAGVNLVEADPEDVTVGYGGLPNEEGVVQLDAAVMDGATMRAGAVAALERIKHPARVALEVMRRTNRVLLVGEGALRFARAHGFHEENLLTERARKIWLYWKENAAPKDDWLPGRQRRSTTPTSSGSSPSTATPTFRPTGTIHLSASRPRAGGRLLHDHLGAVLQAARAASATRRWSAPGCTATRRSARPAAPATARATSSTAAPTP